MSQRFIKEHPLQDKIGDQFPEISPSLGGIPPISPFLFVPIQKYRRLMIVPPVSLHHCLMPGRYIHIFHRHLQCHQWHEWLLDKKMTLPMHAI